jgi:hypothetical protein
VSVGVELGSGVFDAVGVEVALGGNGVEVAVTVAELVGVAVAVGVSVGTGVTVAVALGSAV